MTCEQLIDALSKWPSKMRVVIPCHSDYIEVDAVSEVEIVERGGYVSMPFYWSEPPFPEKRSDESSFDYNQRVQGHYRLKKLYMEDQAKKSTCLRLE